MMASTQQTSDAPIATDPNESFNRLVAILTTSVAILIAISAYFQADATVRADRAVGESLRYAIKALGTRASGVLAVGHGHYTTQTSDELEKLAVVAENDGDAAAARRYRAVSADLVRLSPMLSTYGANQGQYEAELYVVESTALTERFTLAAQTNDYWDDKNRAHVVHLALLAVTLVLYGLSTSIGGRLRWMFVAVGSALAGLVVVLAILVFLRPMPTLPDEAIDAYARGVGLLHQEKASEAVAAFSQALDRQPDYTNARLRRADAHLVSRSYQLAATDYEHVRTSGREDGEVAALLGWTYYLLGRFSDAVQLDRRALELNPDPPTRIAVQFNLALAELAAGNIEQARKEYAEGMATAAEQVTRGESSRDLPYSFWAYLDGVANDLDHLMDRLARRPYPWIEAPPREAVVNPDLVQPAARQLFFELKSLYLALERTGRPPRGGVGVRITSLQFALDEDYDEDDDYEIASVFPSDTSSVLMLFDYQGLEPSQPVQYRVYRNGTEDPSLRRPIEGLGRAGEAEVSVPLVFDVPGEYTVEVYVDYQLIERGRFTIRDS